MPRSPSLLLAAFLVATLASPTVRGEGSPLPPVPPPPASGSQTGGSEPSSRLLQHSPAPQARRRKGLMIGGIAILGGSYLLTVLVVLNSLGSSNGMAPPECGDECKARPRLLIPIVGPWLAMPYAIRDDAKLFTVLGLAQATGVVLSIIGISQFIADAPTAASRSTPKVSFGLLPARDGAFGFASARF